MSNKYSKKKSVQLGMDASTAAHKLRKMLLFDFARQLGKDTCFRCSTSIDNIEEFSVEHKLPWLDSDNPIDLFFDLDNIAFSHLNCNVRESRNPHQKYFSEEERKLGRRQTNTLWIRNHYDSEKRREKYRQSGH